MLYRDEKFKQMIHRQIRIVWQTAAASRERTCWFGGLAVLAWMACVANLKPPQETRNIIPHMVAICAAYSIGETIKGSLKKASDTQKSVIQIRKNLETAQTTDELRQIYRDLGKLEDRFIIKASRQKD
ncbi:MAG: hypothetical protein IKS41_07190 [Alphaproteobacteria bacterium]|nr:hypothetical protein [Alphaproteobacteria bacterium]